MAKEPAENTSELISVILSPVRSLLILSMTSKESLKIYEHSVLVVITENNPEDDATVNEYNHRAVLRVRC